MYTSPQDKSKNQTALEKIKEAWEENPVAVIGVATLAVTALAKFIDAVSSAQGRRAYAKQVNLKAKRPAKVVNYAVRQP